MDRNHPPQPLRKKMAKVITSLYLCHFNFNWPFRLTAKDKRLSIFKWEFDSPKGHHQKEENMLEKNLKKQRAKLLRGKWSCARPVTQAVPNKKAYNRKKNKKGNDNYGE